VAQKRAGPGQRHSFGGHLFLNGQEWVLAGQEESSESRIWFDGRMYVPFAGDAPLAPVAAQPALALAYPAPRSPSRTLRYSLLSAAGVIALLAGLLVAPGIVSAGSHYAAKLACAASIAGSACGRVQTSGPAPAVTVASVNYAIENSTMRTAHFTLTGSFFVKGANLPASGAGVEQLRPEVALQVRLTLVMPDGGRLTVDSIVVGGRVYSRVGSGRWTSQPEKILPNVYTTYLGEETFGGTSTWRVHCETSTSTFDTWVRESDGYFVYQKFKDPRASLFMTFDSYNKSPRITAP
jgi:hypothetical protein